MKDRFSGGRSATRKRLARQASDQSRRFTIHITRFHNQKKGLWRTLNSPGNQNPAALVPLRIPARTGSSTLFAPFCPSHFC
jgi:hypothetical protein